MCWRQSLRSRSRKEIATRPYSLGVWLTVVSRDWQLSQEDTMAKITAKLGAALYVCWGLLHFTAAYGVYKLAQNSPATMVQGRLMQTAFYLAAFAATAIVLALTLNWRSDRLGFWVNGVMVGIADIPFIL